MDWAWNRRVMSSLQPVDSVLERLRESASVERVFGDPVESHGKTVVPVARIAYGVGGGFGSEPAEDGADDQAEGGGVGGGVSARPVGALEITDTGTRFVRASDRRKLLGALVLGVVLGLVLGRR